MSTRAVHHEQKPDGWYMTLIEVPLAPQTLGPFPSREVSKSHAFHFIYGVSGGTFRDQMNRVGFDLLYGRRRSQTRILDDAEIKRIEGKLRDYIERNPPLNALMRATSMSIYDPKVEGGIRIENVGPAE